MSGIRGWCAVVVVGLAFASAHAEIGAGNGELGMDIGYPDFDPQAAENGYFYMGFRGGYHATKLFEAEGQLGMAVGEAGDFTAIMFSAFVNAVFNAHVTPNVVPYALAGYGRCWLNYSYNGVEEDLSLTDSGPAYQFGVGSRFFVGKKKKTAIRVEWSSLTEDSWGASARHTGYYVGVTVRTGRARGEPRATPQDEAESEAESAAGPE